MSQIINTRADLNALRGTPAYGDALRDILGTATTWVNTAPEGSEPSWERVTVLSTIEKMGFLTLEEMLEECSAAGVTPPPPSSAPTAPEKPATILICTDLQFRLALNALGLRETVENYVASASQDVRDWWDRATMIHADSLMLQATAAAIGKTQEDIDAAIKLGMTLA